MKTRGKTGAIAIIPVRVDSQRLPGKALLAESGKPLFLHTCDQALLAECFDEVLVATDDERVVEAAGSAGIKPIMTSDRPRTGSERCAEVATELDAGVVVNIQGDWPEVDPRDLRALVDIMRAQEPEIGCATLAAPLTDPRRIEDPNVVKIVRGHDAGALYFSRLPVPYDRADIDNRSLLRHIGVYAFSRSALLSIPDLPSSGLDEREGLEQLKFLENRIPIKVLDAAGDPWGIEVRADYDAFLQRNAQRTS